ncbi:MAG TPA: transketolase [Dongiaceae bacterium]|nr:transketolase [Dongiaceae bacterium]
MAIAGKQVTSAAPTDHLPLSIEVLRDLECKVLWLSTQIIHHANHERENIDGLKVGGHQASSASLVTIMTALYFAVLRPEDRVAVKPHASPVFHAIQYLLGNQDLEKLKGFRALGGAQSYPSRTKDTDDVDFSTGSVGLGVAMTSFASLVQDYIHAHDWGRVGGEGQWPVGRMVALAGDAELDEGNIYEALVEGWKHGLRNTWWIIDYNRQSLDAVISAPLTNKLVSTFENMGWRVVTVKYGKKLQALRQRPGGEAILDWFDDCDNDLFSALTFQGGDAWRKQLLADLTNPASRALIEAMDDAELVATMTDLGGHCLESVLEAFQGIETDQPVCFICYTIKGRGLPLAGHKDNHAGLMTPAQMQAFKAANNIVEGDEWSKTAGLNRSAEELDRLLGQVPFNAKGRRRLQAPEIEIGTLPLPTIRGEMSTQQGFGQILAEIARGDSKLAERIVTTSPDVTVSTNLGPWVNRRGVFDVNAVEDVFQSRKLMSGQRWSKGPSGQHLELGIAENNLFLMLAALGLSHEIFGQRLLPIGTLYDPFIARGLDALNYACYQDARFILVATPSGITLAPEGGAHQSVSTPLIGMAQDGIASFEPTYVDELGVILQWAFAYIQRAPKKVKDGSKAADAWLHERDGGSVYLRLSTRSVEQIIRPMTPELRDGIINGGYWLRQPAEGAELAIVYTGAVAPEAATAMGELLGRFPGAGLLAITSADRLNAGWKAAQTARQHGDQTALSSIEELLMPLSAKARLVTVLDGHPTTLSWLGSVYGHNVQALGVEHFGQTGTIPDLYARYRIDTRAIVEAALAPRDVRRPIYRR